MENKNIETNDVDLSSVDTSLDLDSDLNTQIVGEKDESQTWSSMPSSQDLDYNATGINVDAIDTEISEEKIDSELQLNRWTQLDESVFLDSWDASITSTNKTDNTENFGKYLRWFFVSSVCTVLGIIVIAALFSFKTYITKASQDRISAEDRTFVDQYKDKLSKVKSFFGKENKDAYQSINVWTMNSSTKVNEIINASDIDYIDKKDILTKYVSDLVRDSQDGAVKIDAIKQEIAKQWFLPEELWWILSDDEAIDTIQRSLNALEVIKFSTATKVFSYMNTALATISQMVRTSGAWVDAIRQLLTQLISRWEKDISAYVYMCYLNPFEVGANCDSIGDLDLYYDSIIRDNSININLFKNTMNAINQLLEKEDTAMFSITFNWFNAQDKNITFNIEVYTNQSDERALLAQWKRNPNIFILTNIINLLKQSSFIIWAEINTKEVNVETRTLSLGWLSSVVNYSSKDFTVPIQKDTEREIFDYIDLEGIDKLLSKQENDNEGDSNISNDNGTETYNTSENLYDTENSVNNPTQDDYYEHFDYDTESYENIDEVNVEELEDYVGYNNEPQESYSDWNETF